MESAKGKKGASPPPQLVFAWWCERFQVLPREGSLRQQDYREMYRISVLPNIYDAVVQWRTSGGAKLSPGSQAIINWLVKTELMNRATNG